VILVDTSVWVDHLRKDNSEMRLLLDGGRVLIHPFVVGELAMANLNRRDFVLAALRKLPEALVAREEEVLQFVAASGLFGLGIGLGIGYIDAHLLTSVQLTPGSTLWTREKRMLEVAGNLGLAAKR
jgi:predicted nucleic acid-binding protein